MSPAGLLLLLFITIIIINIIYIYYFQRNCFQKIHAKILDVPAQKQNFT